MMIYAIQLTTVKATRPCKWLASLVLMLAFSCQASATDTTQSLDMLKTMVEDFISEETQHIDGDVEYTVTPLDSRLRLSDCSKNLNVFLPSGYRLEGNSTISVKCTDPSKLWSVFLSARIDIYKPVVVAKLPIERGKIISEADITTQKQEVSTLRNSYFVNPDNVIGKVSSRRLAIGTPLSSGAISSTPLVKKGERVTIIAIVNSLEVRMMGKALDNGKEGDVIKVQNLNSSRIIEGRVSHAGVVQVRI